MEVLFRAPIVRTPGWEFKTGENSEKVDAADLIDLNGGGTAETFESLPDDDRPDFEECQMSPTRFTYNSQDPGTLPDHSISLAGVRANDGGLETDLVVLRNNKLVQTPEGQNTIVPGPTLRIEPNTEGHFVYPQGHLNDIAVRAFATAAATAAKYDEVLRKLTGRSLAWAFEPGQLSVSPQVASEPLGFYSRSHAGIHFAGSDEKSNTANSGEIVSHETGHAILDGRRPSYLGSPNIETRAFHEAFGNIVAQLMTLGDPVAIDKLIEQTGGDLSSGRNILSTLGEVLGPFHENMQNDTLNQFEYKDPRELPSLGDEERLGGQRGYDFSRLWSGAFYDLLDEITKANRTTGMSPKDSLIAAGEEGWRLLVGQIECAPFSRTPSFKDLANALLEGDMVYNDGARSSLITATMKKRKIF